MQVLPRRGSSLRYLMASAYAPASVGGDPTKEQPVDDEDRINRVAQALCTADVHERGPQVRCGHEGYGALGVGHQ